MWNCSWFTNLVLGYPSSNLDDLNHLIECWKIRFFSHAGTRKLLFTIDKELELIETLN